MIYSRNLHPIPETSLETVQGGSPEPSPWFIQTAQWNLLALPLYINVVPVTTVGILGQ